MKRAIAVSTVCVASLFACAASAQAPAKAPAQPTTMSTTTVGVSVTQMEAVAIGWSAKKDLIGKTVMNDKKDKIGKIVDLIITPMQEGKVPTATYAIVGVGGFLGVGANDVAIPMEQIKLEGGNLTLPNATKEALKALPKFEYRKR